MPFKRKYSEDYRDIQRKKKEDKEKIIKTKIIKKTISI